MGLDSFALCPTGPKRERGKKKNFDRAWSTYSDEFRQWYNGLPCSHRTQVINNGIQRGPGGSLTNNIMVEFKTKEKIEASKERSSGWKSEGHIQEVAEEMVGGHERLVQAIRRGAVKVHREGEVELFSFPKSEVSAFDKKNHIAVSEATGDSNLEAHSQVKVVSLNK